MLEPSSVARHNRPAQRDQTDDSDASTHTPTVSHHGAPNNPRALTPLDTARSFMDDNQPSFIETTSGTSHQPALRQSRRPRRFCFLCGPGSSDRRARSQGASFPGRLRRMWSLYWCPLASFTSRAIWTRLLTSSLPSRRETWALTVGTERCRAAAISALA